MPFELPESVGALLPLAFLLVLLTLVRNALRWLASRATRRPATAAARTAVPPAEEPPLRRAA